MILGYVIKECKVRLSGPCQNVLYPNNICATEVAPFFGVGAPRFILAGQRSSPARNYPVLCHVRSPPCLFVAFLQIFCLHPCREDECKACPKECDL